MSFANHQVGRVFAAVVLTIGALAINRASAAASLTLIRDNFGGIDGTNVNGRTPDTTDLPGTTWAGAVDNGSWPITIQSNMASSGPDSGEYISLAGANNNAAILRLSASLSTTSTNDQGVGIGFANAVSPGLGLGGFHGVIFGRPNSTAGSHALLRLVDTFSDVATAIDLGAGFDETVSHAVSYTINTGLNTISNLTVDGTPLSFSGSLPAGFFGASNTNYAVFGSHATIGATNLTDDFQLDILPEPASLGLLSGGALLVIGRRQRRNGK